MPTHSSITAGAAPRPPRKHELRYCSLSSSDMFTDLSARTVQLQAYLDPWHNLAMHTTGHRDLLTERSDQTKKCILYALTMPSSMQHHSTWDAHKEEKVPRQHACCNGKTAGRRPAIPARWLHSSLSIPHVVQHCEFHSWLDAAAHATPWPGWPSVREASQSHEASQLAGCAQLDANAQAAASSTSCRLAN
jgi:hypothetical protein